jgi:NADH-quinone oxidoreductase subunit G
MATLYIDNKPYEVKSGKNLLETCLSLGLDLPYFCWHPSLGSVGACRQCAIKVFKDENDTKGRIVMACMEPVADNQRISVSHPDAVEMRANVIESLMTNHPHDCAVCDEGGSCHLQDMTVMSGHNYRRFKYNKRTFENQDLGPFINHEMNRCITCYRCVRFYRDYAGGRDLDAFASRSNVYFGRAEDGPLESEFSGNLAEICPTGVFTDKTLKEHYTRKWDLTMAPSVCQHCSLGCNTIAGERYGELRMIANRYNGEVNGYFLCDRGRFGYEFTNSERRIKQPFIAKFPVSKTQVLSEISTAIQKGKVIGIGSPRASLQSNFALKELVGSDHFYHGVSDNEHNLAELILKILNEGPTRSATMHEVEKADAVLILGEDLTNTAPMLALAVRQSVKQQPMKEVANANIPSWHNAAAKELIQEAKGPLFIATINTTKLDDIATETYHAAPDDMARLGFAIANLLDPVIPQVNKLPKEQQQLAERIADALSRAERPMIISGASCETQSVIKAAANVAWALHKKNKNTGLVYTLPECNSVGLALMGGKRLNSAFDAVMNEHADTVIIMENDLYRHGKPADVDAFLKKAKRVIVFDHIVHPTVEMAHVVVPAGAFSESDGIIVNNEGRAQRYFQVYECHEMIQESWRWILDISKHEKQSTLAWGNFEGLTRTIAESEPLLKEINRVSPPAAFRIAGQKIPRAPQRQSGRTAILANINVSEPKPPVDPDSMLSYTMEGYKGLAPSAAIPFFWSPGWNSVQSVNKYQEEVGGALKGGDPGIRMIEPNSKAPAPYFTQVPEPFTQMKDHLWTVPLYHIFGSEELSVLGDAVSKRSPKSYIMINVQDAAEQKLSEGQELAFDVEGQLYRLPVTISTTLPKGLVGLPYGLPGLPYVELPAWLIYKK